MKGKWLMKQQQLVKQENKEELEKVKSQKIQQLPTNPNNVLKYLRGLGQWGKALNKALVQGKYAVDYQYRRVSLWSPCIQKYPVQVVPTIDEEVALIASKLIDRIYDESEIEIETIRY
uniref:Uncharacterized protein n=1 Tax=Romanomermis culicivorax TaxID=13658 RepID=A0A915I2M8_ROMCU